MAAHRKTAHRKPKQRPFTGPAARTAATLALAGAATAAASGTPAGADPQLTSAQVKARVDRLYREAEVATEHYNGAKEQVTSAARAVEDLRDEAARRTQRLNASRDAIGALAAAQYRGGGLNPALQLALSSDPDEYLERASYVDRAADRQSSALRGIQGQIVGIAQLRARAGREIAALTSRRAELAEHRSTVHAKLADARKLLATLTASERAAYETSADAAHGTSLRAGRSASRSAVAAPHTRAAQAVAFAYSSLGKPYVWGATGPSAYDCSGLTQAAWRAAGVALPRTTYTQINAGTRVSRSQLAPGDLVFFYAGITHVGLYIGGGQMIHAPRPGAPIRVASISDMPFAGATRVG
ncbi:C40 family peptidase [uncultured Streptomyces sp.]|uniref:C40 family peptidase n=1 Tax=uncultured Streptomyces sp. TaxID=174707 RepID=UPI0026072BE8|nr:C40 family peptidase [uncultured Streptomyces sp.]